MSRRPLRKIAIMLGVTLAILGLPLASGAGAQAPTTDADTPALSVVTLNLWHDKGDWPRREVQIVAALQALRPDVIALQEVFQHEGLPNQAQTIADALGYEVYFVSTDPVGKPQRYGNALLTRHRILERESKALQPLDDFRTAAHLRIAIGGRAVDVYATHLHHTGEGGAIRERQLRDLREFIAQTSDGAPVLIAGDFNAGVSQPEMGLLVTDYVDSYGSLHPDAVAGGHTTLNPAYFKTGDRIDHVFAQRGRFTVEQARIILDHSDANGVWPSDHFGVQVSLRMTAPVRVIEP